MNLENPFTLSTSLGTRNRGSKLTLTIGYGYRIPRHSKSKSEARLTFNFEGKIITTILTTLRWVRMFTGTFGIE